MQTLRISAILFLCVTTTTARLHAQDAATNTKKARPVNPAFAVIEDDPRLPRVLLIGDSISIGYTVDVREKLHGKANVHRIRTNGGPTTRGLDSIDQWLGDGKWDVIHFNWGLHDLKFIDGKHQVPLDDYTKNLKRLVERLQQTGTTLIWCNTTPVPDGTSPPRTNDDVLKFNEAAARIMKTHDVRTNDLYTFANERLAEIQLPMNVHFTPEGSKVLAEPVAASILAAIESRAVK